MTAAARSSPSLSDHIVLLLTLEWLDANDLVAFDTANQSNQCMRPIWSGVVRRFRDIGCMRRLLYTHHWIRWLITKKIRTSSMRVMQVSTDCTKDDTFEDIYLPGLESIRVDCGCDMTDTSIKLISAGCVNLLSIDLTGCSQLTWESLEAVGLHCRGLMLIGRSALSRADVDRYQWML